MLIKEIYLKNKKKFVIFFKKCKYHNISITLDPNLINRALNSIIKTKRKQIKMDMYLNNWNALSLYLQEIIKFSFSFFKKRSNDFLPIS